MKNNRLTKDDLIAGFRSLGLVSGDTIFIRASLVAVGSMPNLPSIFIDALLCVIGEEGTIVSLAFTKSYLMKRPDKNVPFRMDTPTYAGALPQTMIRLSQSKRSRHPTCSFVAIGKNAEYITADHGPDSPAFEPMRKIIELGGKMVLVGCVLSSPGFTTTHLAEYDLKMMKKIAIPWPNSCYYEDDGGKLKLFKRMDPGFCSISYWKFYSFYVIAGILRSAFVGNAYSIMVPAKEAYVIEKEILSKDHKFNICNNPDCFMCNAGRWDRVYRIPMFVINKISKKLRNKK